MTKEILLEQHNACYDQNNWFVAVKSALEGLTAEEAAWKPEGADNTIWEEVQITFKPGVTPVQFASDNDVLAAAAAGKITLTDTEEFYRCSVVGSK